jgi:hypothetical protein
MVTSAIDKFLAEADSAASVEARAELLQAAVHERWSVKTGADAGAANLVAQVPTNTDIAHLRSLSPPAQPLPDTRSADAENTVWALDATLTLCRLEQDQDYHLVIADDQGNTMIAEIPNPAAFTSKSFFADQIAAARKAIDDRLNLTEPAASAAGAVAAAPSSGKLSIPVALTGLGFFDFIHGQTGVAPNGIELHPVTSIVFHS